MTDRELMQMALDALRLCTALPTWPSITPVIEALRARLSQCERCGEVNSAEIHTCSPQEPQIKQRRGDCLLTGVCAAEGHRIQKPQLQQRTYTLRKWQGLTDEEAEQITDLHWDDPDMFIEAIEEVLRRKNS